MARFFMCIAIEFAKNEFSERELRGLVLHGEVARVALSDRRPVLPVRTASGNKLLNWGNRGEGVLEHLPKTAHCKKESLLSGRWSWLRPQPVEILAKRGFANGVWFQIRRGIQGVLVRDGRGVERVYMLTEPSTHYFKTMTGMERMPVLVGEVI